MSILISLAYVVLQFYSSFRMEQLILSHMNLVYSELLYQALKFKTKSMCIVNHSSANLQKSVDLPPSLSSDGVIPERWRKPGGEGY